MRSGRLLLTAAGILSLAAAASVAVAQQQPIHGCHAATSCQPLGFSTIDRSVGLGSGFLGVGMGVRFGPGFEIVLPTPIPSPVVSGQPIPSPTPNADVFHLNTSLLPPTPAPTPVPAVPALPTPAAAPPRAKN
jgi:hypothetical protein